MTRKYQWLVTIIVMSMLVFSFSIATAILIPINQPTEDTKPVLEKKVYKLYKEGYAKPPGTPGGKPDKDPAASCYEFLARGAKWKSVEDYIVDPSNNAGLAATDIYNVVDGSVAAWETAAGTNILGNRDTNGIVDGADEIAPDDKNEIYFANIAEENVIGVTIVWGFFGGPPKDRMLIEFDMVLDDYDFDWGILDPENPDMSKMDLENIVIHEMGHAVGMGDLYDSACSEMTMYGYASLGETKKRSLETGDIEGVKSLYK